MGLRVRSMALLSGLRIRHCCELDAGHRRGSDLQWLWCRLVATALIRPLAWEPPYVMGAALNGQERGRKEGRKRKKRKKRKKEKKRKERKKEKEGKRKKEEKERKKRKKGKERKGRKKRQTEKNHQSLSLGSLFFIWLHPQHVEVAEPGIKLMPQQQLSCYSDNTGSLTCRGTRKLWFPIFYFFNFFLGLTFLPLRAA